MPWVTLDDVVGIYLAALGNPQFSGPVNGAAPAPATNREFSKALGRALHRPAVVPVPGFALKLMFGEMASVITSSARLVPGRASELGYAFTHPDLDGALAAVL
jgi:NAD dependent epimerase/dehydratase family enzyme